MRPSTSAGSSIGGELLGVAESCGLELVREYALVGPIGVAGAPENPRHSGFLLRRTSG